MHIGEEMRSLMHPHTHHRKRGCRFVTGRPELLL
jgi:hypothetical protein